MWTPYDNIVRPLWTMSSCPAPMRIDLISLQKYLNKYKLLSSFNKRDLGFNNEVLSLSKNSQEWLKASYKEYEKITKPLQRHNGILPFSPQNIPSFHAFTKQVTLIYIAKSHNPSPYSMGFDPKLNGIKIHKLIDKRYEIHHIIHFWKCKIKKKSKLNNIYGYRTILYGVFTKLSPYGDGLILGI